MNTYLGPNTDRSFAIDTTFVLFFLGLDLGISFTSAGFDAILSGITLATFVVVPYLLPADGEKPEFAGWVAGRTLIALFAVSLGWAFSFTLGDSIPAGLSYLPMTLLIVSAIASCYMQFFSVLRLRLAK